MTIAGGGGARRWRLGSVGGTPVYLAPSWLLVAAVLTLLFLPTVQLAAPRLSTPVAVLAATSFPILLFASVLAHELAHGGAAKALGLPVREYVLTFWGGHTSFGSDLRTPGVSALVSAAGPLANGVLAVVGWGLLRVVEPGLPAVILASLTYTNAIVAVFNLLPGSPLDGGRILEALVWKVTGDRDTGAIGAGWVGRVLAGVIVAWFLLVPLAQGRQPTLTGAAWAAVIGYLVWSGASQSIRLGRARRSAAGFDLRPLLRPAQVVDVRASVAAVPAAPWGVAPPAIVLVDPAGSVVGVADPAALAAVPGPVRPSTPLTAVARALPATAVVTALQGSAALGQVARGIGASDVLVAVSEHGVLGVVPRDVLLAALQPPGR
ncbi:site-2 protease family protein [Miniimonas sp. S16]|uniref:site-2 protease family protein n=1 Tax=Miniimonas sp. S16 TaxID=2171623 RepID=UPI000D5276BA|nr:site-2 protease family protein [Miniimonas sp. S16]